LVSVAGRREGATTTRLPHPANLSGGALRSAPTPVGRRKTNGFLPPRPSPPPLAVQNPGNRAIQCDFPFAASDPQYLVRRGPCGGTPLLRRGMARAEKKYRTQIPKPSAAPRGGGILSRAAVNDARCKSLSWYSRGVCRRLRRCIAVSVRVYYMGLIILQRAQSLGQEYTTEEEGPPAPPAWVLLWHFRDEQGSFRPRNSGD